MIAPLVEEALDSLTDDARITIEVHEAIVGLVESEVGELVAETGFAGRVRVQFLSPRRALLCNTMVWRVFHDPTKERPSVCLSVHSTNSPNF